MKAIILAAGRGSRMKNLTEDLPKCLVQLNGKALLDWQLQALERAGISNIAIVTGYRRASLLDRGLQEFHNPRWSETNMVSSLECAASWLRSEPCVVSYSDIFYDASAVVPLMESNADLAVTYDPGWLELWRNRFVDPLSDAETFRMTENDALIEIGNKPQSTDEVEGQYMGLLRFTPIGWAEIERLRASISAGERDRMHMTGTLQRIIESGRIKISVVPYYGDWGEVDSESDLRYYQKEI